MRIDEFEFRNEKGQEIEPTKAMLVVYIKALHKDIKTLEKAIELACDHVEYVITKDGTICSGLYNENKDKIINYFKTKAKEMMKSEQRKDM